MVTYEIIIECDNCHHPVTQSAPVEVENAEQVFIAALTSRYGWVTDGERIYCPNCAGTKEALIMAGVDSNIPY